jgi:hypothetical protein
MDRQLHLRSGAFRSHRSQNGIGRHPSGLAATLLMHRPAGAPEAASTGTCNELLPPAALTQVINTTSPNIIRTPRQLQEQPAAARQAHSANNLKPPQDTEQRLPTCRRQRGGTAGSAATTHSRRLGGGGWVGVDELGALGDGVVLLQHLQVGEHEKGVAVSEK